MRCTEAWICSLEAAPLAAMARFTVAGGRVTTATFRWQRGQADHAARVSHEDGRAGKPVLGVQILQHDQVGGEAVEDPDDAVVDAAQARLQRDVRWPRR